MFGERLIELRKEKRLSQKECAAAFGVDASKYNKWENEKNCPDYETVCRLAQFFNTTTDYLLGNSNVRHLPDQVELQDWQRALQAQLMNSLQSFYIKTDNLPMPELNIVLLIGIRQAFQKILKTANTFICSINQLPQPLPAFESSVDQFLSVFKSLHIEDGLMLEVMLRDALEKNVPAYKDYRGIIIDEWVRQQIGEE
ncbi:MAG: helix-turn-helix transcriptional regulator [Eubacteriales bacterium]